MTRVKQTARKSTGAAARSDPVQSQMSTILKAKRENRNKIKQEDASSVNTSTSTFASGSSGGSNLRTSVGGKSMANIMNGGVKIKPRVKQSDGILSQIRALRTTYQLLIPRAAFHRVVREVTQDVVTQRKIDRILYQTAALEALQEAAESYLVGLFEDSYQCTIHAKRVTLFKSDMDLCRKLQRSGAMRA